MKGKMLKGEVTAFLSLIFVLLLSFVSAVLQSVSIQVSKNTSRVVVTEAVESVFAEYQKELMEEYDIFALDGSYETGGYSEMQITDRLGFYGTKNMDVSIEKLQLLTDNKGQAFREQVAYYMKHKYGISALENFTENSKSWKEQKIEGEKYQKTDKETTGKLEETLQENDRVLPDEDNPLAHISQLKSSGFLQLVSPSDANFSEKSVELSSQPSNKSLHKGHGSIEIDSSVEAPLSNIILDTYIKDHFVHATTNRGMPVFFLVFLVTIYTAFYYHDKDIIYGAAHETAVVISTMNRRARGVTKADASELFLERIQGKLILFSRVSVSVSINEEEVVIDAKADRNHMKICVQTTCAVTRPEEYIRSLRRVQDVLK